MKKSQSTKTYVGKDLKAMIVNQDSKMAYNGDVIIKAETLKNVKAIKVVSEVGMTETQFEMIMGAIGGINKRLNQMDTKFTKRLDEVDRRLDNIEKDVIAIKNCPTIKKELSTAS